jgi:carboxymethylenebutenolidase
VSIRWEKTAVGTSSMRTYVALHDDAAPRPGVIVAMHGLGIDAVMFDVVHRLHRAGYAVALADLFHRQPLEWNQPKSRATVMRDEEIVADLNAALSLLKSMAPGCGPFGVTGFCMGGRASYLMATANRELRAAAVFYGGGIGLPWGGGRSPLESTVDIGCPVLGLFGAEDGNPSPEDIQAIDAELTRLGKWHEFHTYRDAGHAFLNFMNPERYRERAAKAAWGELLAFFGKFLAR